ncbi:DUF1476 domain-containing protein [Desertibaculum subflavum]|uniref:DUF1476 domain-containing protein n=1 Tax=Desertibaculum subflavum TaxID=2268458 RepID=UPI000E66AA72
MTSFKDREVAEEAKYALDEETKFKMEARRNKLLGLWAAERMGMTGDAAEAYAKAVVASDFEKAGEEDVYEKVAADLKARHVTVTEKELRAKMAALREDARKQIVGQ